MAQDGKVIAFNIDDGKLREVLTDPSGGSNTFGPWVDVFGVNGFQLQPEYLKKELNGDGTVLDIFSKLKKLTGSFNCQMVFAMMVILMGGEATFSGTSPNEQGVFELSGTDLPKNFEFDFQSLYRGGSDASGGDFHINVYKAKMTSFSYSMASEEYATLTINWEAVPRLTDGKFGRFVENETRIDLSEGASDTTPPTVSSTSPADAATGVAVTANVTWTFSEDIQFDAGHYNLYEITSTTNTPAVAAAVTYDSTTFVVTLNPTASLTGTKQHVAIAAGVRDKAGNQLATPSIINFTTV